MITKSAFSPLKYRIFTAVVLCVSIEHSMSAAAPIARPGMPFMVEETVDPLELPLAIGQVAGSIESFVRNAVSAVTQYTDAVYTRSEPAASAPGLLERIRRFREVRAAVRATGNMPFRQESSHQTTQEAPVVLDPCQAADQLKTEYLKHAAAAASAREYCFMPVKKCDIKQRTVEGLSAHKLKIKLALNKLLNLFQERCARREVGFDEVMLLRTRSEDEADCPIMTREQFDKNFADLKDGSGDDGAFIEAFFEDVIMLVAYPKNGDITLKVLSR